MAQHDLTAGGRRKLAAKGIARPDGSYPISDQADLDKAVNDWGRTGSSLAVKAWIEKKAKQLNLELPETWEKKGSDDEMDVARTINARR